MKSILRETQTSLWAGIIVVGMFCTTAASLAAEGAWIRKTDMPTKRFGTSIAQVDGKLYVIGGSQVNERLATVEVYDPATDSWRQRADMPTARKSTAAAVVNGIIYVFGGTQIRLEGMITTTEAYDPKTDTWTAKQDMPTARGALAAVPVNGKIYVIGGYGVHGAEVSAVEVYDPVTDTWEDKAPLPVASGNFAFAGFNGKIYVFGGIAAETALRNTREYDPVTDRWTTKAAMPTARFQPEATVLDGKVYVLGGNYVLRNPNLPDSYPVTGRVDLYDPVTDTWQAGVSMPTARTGLASATAKGKIYAIGGQTGVSWDEPGTIYATVEEFSLPAAPAPPLTIQESVLLSWKRSGTDYVVQSASFAQGPWTNVAKSESQLVVDEVHMTVIQTGAAQFFRLAATP